MIIRNITILDANTALNTHAREIEKKITDTEGFIFTPKFSISKKVNFNARMKEATKTIANKIQVNTALYIADKVRKKIKT